MGRRSCGGIRWTRLFQAFQAHYGFDCSLCSPYAGRHTEIDMFSGALIRMGKELGIPTPYNEFAYHMIKALEEKNDGKFDYTGPNQEMTWAK